MQDLEVQVLRDYDSDVNAQKMAVLSLRNVAATMEDKVLAKIVIEGASMLEKSISVYWALEMADTEEARSKIWAHREKILSR